MVTLRQSLRRGVRISTPATKTTNPARRADRRPVLAPTVPDPIIPPPSSILMNIPLRWDPVFAIISYDWSGDNHGSSIISEVLNGTNYSTWILAITIALDAKNKLSFVDGSLPSPSENHPHYRIWFRWNSMVKSYP